MLNRFLLIIGLTAIINSYLLAQTNTKVEEMINLPHPIKVIMPNMKMFEISKLQEKELNEKMLKHFPVKFQALMQKAEKLEYEIVNDVLIDKKSKEQLASKVDELEKVKREMTDIHIDALNTLATILNKKQFEKSVEISTKKVVKSNKFRIDELALLPHPGKYVKMGKVKLNKDQKVRLTKEVKAVYPVIFQAKMREAFKLEKKLQRAVAKGKTKEQLSGLLDDIAKLKREAMDGRIDALNHMKKIMTKQQWKKINKLTYK